MLLLLGCDFGSDFGSDFGFDLDSELMDSTKGGEGGVFGVGGGFGVGGVGIRVVTPAEDPVRRRHPNDA